MKDQKPELEHIETCIAKTGDKLTVKVASFENPIYESGPIQHCILRVEDERGNLWHFLNIENQKEMAIMFFPERMNADELELKCLEIVDNLESNGTPLILKK